MRIVARMQDAKATFIPGLVSITFRKLSPEQIVERARAVRLESIEWGGDVHVPHGDLDRARQVAKLTRDAGLAVAAYGSYYRAGGSELGGLPFQRVLATAVELGAPTIRVWAGKKGSRDATGPDRAAIADDLKRIADLAGGAKVTVSLEHHEGTLTDAIDSHRALLDAAPQVKTLWQPPHEESVEHNLASLRAVLDRLTNVHVFHWDPRTKEKHPLRNGAAKWRQYLDVIRTHGGTRHVLLEFVRNDDPEQLPEDAATLVQWIAEAK